MIRTTSVETFNEIKSNGLLSLRRWQVYEVLYNLGPSTGAQIAKQVKAIYGSWGHSETIRNRLTELRDTGCISECGEVDCPISGNRVLQWQTNDNLPVKFEKRRSEAWRLVNDIFNSYGVFFDEVTNRRIQKFLK